MHHWKMGSFQNFRKTLETLGKVEEFHLDYRQKDRHTQDNVENANKTNVIFRSVLSSSGPCEADSSSWPGWYHGWCSRAQVTLVLSKSRIVEDHKTNPLILYNTADFKS